MDFRKSKQDISYEYTNPNLKKRLAEQQEEETSLLGMIGKTGQDLRITTGQLIANYNKFFDKQGPEISRQFQNTILDIEDILNESSIEDVNDPNVYLSLARNPGIRKLVIELFTLRLRQMGRPENDITEDLENVTDASIAIVLASILLTSEINLTYQYSASEDDLNSYLNRLKKHYIKKTKLGGKHFRKTKYSRKRKTKRRHSTRRKTRRKRRTRRK
jgi:hypothetical protein